MKTSNPKTLKDGSTQVVVTLAKGEVLLAVKADRFYKLGEPMDDVVDSCVLTNAAQVYWCSVEQQWRDAR